MSFADVLASNKNDRSTNIFFCNFKMEFKLLIDGAEIERLPKEIIERREEKIFVFKESIPRNVLNLVKAI